MRCMIVKSIMTRRPTQSSSIEARTASLALIHDVSVDMIILTRLDTQPGWEYGVCRPCANVRHKVLNTKRTSGALATTLGSSDGPSGLIFRA